MKPLVLPPLPAPRDSLSAARVGDTIRVDVWGTIFGNRVVAMITPTEARRLALELARLAQEV